jgi:hypothetical protein
MVILKRVDMVDLSCRTGLGKPANGFQLEEGSLRALDCQISRSLSQPVGYSTLPFRLTGGVNVR